MQPSPAVVMSSSRLQCTAPPSAPGEAQLSLRMHGAIVATFARPYTYLPSLATLTISTSNVLAAGGSTVIASGAGLPATGRFECRFADKITPAYAVNSTSVECASPQLDLDSALFSLLFEGAAISAPQKLIVRRAPAVLYMHPSVVESGSASELTLILSNAPADLDLTILIDGIMLDTVSGNGAALSASLPSLAAGPHSLQLLSGGSSSSSPQ